MASLVNQADWESYSKTPAPANAESLLLAASGAIRDVCGWNISREVVEDEPLDTWGSTLINLQTLHLVSIESLVVDGEELVDGTDYVWSRRGAIRRLAGCWPWNYGKVVISYTHGLDPVPENLQAQCVAIAKRFDTAKPGVLAEAVGGTNVQYGDRNAVPGLSDYEIAALGPWMLEPGRSR